MSSLRTTGPWTIINVKKRPGLVRHLIQAHLLDSSDSYHAFSFLGRDLIEVFYMT